MNEYVYDIEIIHKCRLTVYANNKNTADDIAYGFSDCDTDRIDVNLDFDETYQGDCDFVEEIIDEESDD